MGPSKWFVCFFVLCVALCGEAAVFQAKGNNPDNDGCVVGSKKYAPGEDWFVPNECMRYSCHSNQGDYSGASCGVVLVPKHCKLSDVDNTKTYPDCCPNMVCPEEKENGI